MSNLIVKLARAALVAALLLLLAGCPTQTRIGDIARDPGRYYNKEVAITGRVVQSFGALGLGAYEVDDGTGRIWVLSEGFGLPAREAQVVVAGSVIEGASFGGRSYGLALRQTRKRHY